MLKSKNVILKLSCRCLQTNPINGHDMWVEDFNKQKISLSNFQKGILAVGSGLGTWLNPYRADLLFAFCEITSQSAGEKLLEKMLSTASGREIMREKPRITSESVKLSYLNSLAPNTFGKCYANWLNRYRITPDTRATVRFMDDPEVGYIIQRYREMHDFTHVLLGSLPINIHGETVVKWFESVQTQLPMCKLASLAGATHLFSPPRKITRLISVLPRVVSMAESSRFIMSLRLENMLERDIQEVREEVGVQAIKI